MHGTEQVGPARPFALPPSESPARSRQARPRSRPVQEKRRAFPAPSALFRVLGERALYSPMAHGDILSRAFFLPAMPRMMAPRILAAVSRPSTADDGRSARSPSPPGRVHRRPRTAFEATTSTPPAGPYALRLARLGGSAPRPSGPSSPGPLALCSGGCDFELHHDPQRPVRVAAEAPRP